MRPLKVAHVTLRDLTSQDVGRPRKRDFARLNLHLGIFEQPAKLTFSTMLIKKTLLEIRGEFFFGKSEQLHIDIVVILTQQRRSLPIEA